MAAQGPTQRAFERHGHVDKGKRRQQEAEPEDGNHNVDVNEDDVEQQNPKPQQSRPRGANWAAIKQGQYGKNARARPVLIASVYLCLGFYASGHN